MIVTESGKRELLHAGVFHTLETLPGAHEGRIRREDLQTIRDIFDEVYDGRLPAKLAYKDLQPLLSHILIHGLRRDYEFAHSFLLDFTDLLPGELVAIVTSPTGTNCASQWMYASSTSMTGTLLLSLRRFCLEVALTALSLPLRMEGFVYGTLRAAEVSSASGKKRS